MSLRIRLISTALILPLLAGCAALQAPLDDMQVDVEKAAARERGPIIRPGLESLYDKPADPAPMMAAPRRPAPVPPSPESLPFPPGRLDVPQAETLLAGDPMALRFLAVKDLAARGLVPVEDSAQRRDGNLGALLPLTAPLPPASGLERPIPPVAEVVGEIARLADGRGRGNDDSRAAERDFLINRLLPKQPSQRQPWAPQDIASARRLQERLSRLEDAGLITPEQRAAETAAADALIASGRLPEIMPAAITPPPPPKPARKTAGRSGARMPGGVSGQLVVIPSPPEVTAPKLAADAKGPAGVHLLSMGTATHGDRAWDALKKEHAELADLGHTVSRADLGELGVTYRLIAGPMDSAQADKLCATLTPRGQTCTPTPFPSK